METTRIEEFKGKLQSLLREYNVTITTTTCCCLMDYPAITLKINGNDYWFVDEDGFAASMVDDLEVPSLTLKK